MRVGVQVPVQRLARRRGRGAGGRQRDAEQGVGPQPAPVRGAVQFDEPLVELPLRHGREADQRRGQHVAHVADRLADAEPAEAAAAVAQLHGLMAPPRPARGDISPPQDRAVDDDVDLYRGQATAVEDLAGPYLADLWHSVHLDTLFRQS